MHMADDKHDVGGAEGAPPSILAKAFLVIGAFNERDRVLTLTQISRKTGDRKSVV